MNLYSNKLDELKRINERIENRIKTISKHGYSSMDFNESPNFYPELKHHIETMVTSSDVLKLKKGMVSKILSDDVFNRIICLSGKLKIRFVAYSDEAIITPMNTQLIIPDTKYIIEALEDCEIINIYKPAKKGVNYKIIEKETIYNKKTLENE